MQDPRARQLHPASQVRRPGTPQGHATDAQHGRDLGFGNAAIQARQHMRPVDFARTMYTLAANIVDDRAVLFAQVQIRLTHDNTSANPMTTITVYPRSVILAARY